MSIEAAIAEANAKGYRLHNLFQLDTDKWRANVRKDGVMFEFGEDTTATGAIRAALSKVKTVLAFDARPETRPAPKAANEPAESLFAPTVVPKPAPVAGGLFD